MENTYNYELYHHGVKGQKWGVRRYQNQNGTLTPAGKKRYTANFSERAEPREIIRSTTKSGATLVASKNPTPALTRFLSKLSPKVRDVCERSDICKIKVDGKTVGDLQLYKESKDSINVVWVGVSKKHEGQGYGTAAMNGVIQYAKDQKLKHVTLEVPAISPNARHIYEKLGFKTTGEVLGDKDDIWGGLTKMRLDL